MAHGDDEDPARREVVGERFAQLLGQASRHKAHLAAPAAADAGGSGGEDRSAAGGRVGGPAAAGRGGHEALLARGRLTGLQGDGEPALPQTGGEQRRLGSRPPLALRGERAQPSAHLGERHTEELAHRLEGTRARGRGQRLGTQHHLAVGGDQAALTYSGTSPRPHPTSPAPHVSQPPSTLQCRTPSGREQRGDHAGAVVHAGQPRAAESAVSAGFPGGAWVASGP